MSNAIREELLDRLNGRMTAIGQSRRELVKVLESVRDNLRNSEIERRALAAILSSEDDYGVEVLAESMQRAAEVREVIREQLEPFVTQPDASELVQITARAIARQDSPSMDGARLWGAALMTAVNEQTQILEDCGGTR